MRWLTGRMGLVSLRPLHMAAARIILALFYRQLEHHIMVTGKTFPYKDALKALGGVFQAGEKVWMIPYSTASLGEVQTLCRRVGGGPLKAEPLPPPLPVIPAVNAGKSSTTDDGNARLPTWDRDGSEDREITMGEASPAPAAAVSDSMTLGELMAKVQLALTHQFPRAVWVVGEIQNLNQRRNGFYLQLAEGKKDGSQTATITVNATLWSNAMTELQRRMGADTWAQVMQEGLQIRALCQVSLYKDRGSISLNILDIDPAYTKGALALAREKLLKELRQKGLAEANRKLSLTPFPLVIGLITADQSRAMSDFLHQLHSLRYPGSVIFYPAQMQGEAVLTEVVSGIRALARKGVDAIVITRGGGSAADLRWFDSPEVAYAIAETPIPIIAAIGHHDDVCIAEEIAWRREKTPTAAADFIAHVIRMTRERLDQAQLTLARVLQGHWDLAMRAWTRLEERLQQGVTTGLNQKSEQLYRILVLLQQNFSQRLQAIQRSLDLQTQNIREGVTRRLVQGTDLLNQRAFSLVGQMRESLHVRQRQLSELIQGIIWRSRESLAARSERLLVYERQMAAADPSPWLDKGWTRLSKDGVPVTSGQQLNPHDRLEARLKDAQVLLTVEHIEDRTQHRSKS